MGEYEPRDSRKVTHSTKSAPGEPARTGPREAETRTDDPGREPASDADPQTWREEHAQQVSERRKRDPQADKAPDASERGYGGAGERREKLVGEE